MRAFREVASLPVGRLGAESGSADAAGSVAPPGVELAGCVGSTGVVPAGLGALLELLFAGPQATTVHERVPSRRVLRLTSNPISRYSRSIAGICRWFLTWQPSCHVHSSCRQPSSFTLGRNQIRPDVTSGTQSAALVCMPGEAVGSTIQLLISLAAIALASVLTLLAQRAHQTRLLRAH